MPWLRLPPSSCTTSRCALSQFWDIVQKGLHDPQLLTFSQSLYIFQYLQENIQIRAHDPRPRKYYKHQGTISMSAICTDQGTGCCFNCCIGPVRAADSLEEQLALRHAFSRLPCMSQQLSGGVTCGKPSKQASQRHLCCDPAETALGLHCSAHCPLPCSC